MPDEEVGSRGAKHNLLLHNQEGGREGGRTGEEKNTQETEDVLLLLVE